MQPNVKPRDASRCEGRIFYVGPKRRIYCRIDPKMKRIGVQLAQEIRDIVDANGLLRKRRKNETWMYVDEDTDLSTVESLIRQSLAALQEA